MAPLDPLIPESHELGLSLLLHKALCHARIHVINNLIIPFLAISPQLSLYLRKRHFSSSFGQVSPDCREHQGDAHEAAHTRRNTRHSRKKGASAACCGFQGSEREPIYSAHTQQAWHLPPALEWAPEKPVRYAWICDMDTTSHGTLLLSRETMKSSAKLVSHSGRTHPHSEGISPVTYMLGPFWNGPVPPGPWSRGGQIWGRAARWGGWGMEFYLPWLPERIVTTVQRCGGGDRKRICKAAFRIPINQR